MLSNWNLQILFPFFIVRAHNFTSEILTWALQQREADRKLHVPRSDKQWNKCLNAKLQSLRGKERLSYVSSNLVQARLQTLVWVLKSSCHWFLRKVVPDLLQCASTLPNIPFQWFSEWNLASKHTTSMCWSLFSSCIFSSSHLLISWWLLLLYLEQSASIRHVCTLYVCFPRMPEGFPLQAFLRYRNFCSACAVTVVIFGHLNRSFYLLAKNFNGNKISKLKILEHNTICISAGGTSVNFLASKFLVIMEKWWNTVGGKFFGTHCIPHAQPGFSYESCIIIKDAVTGAKLLC